MKAKFGIFLMAIGTVLVAAALALYLHNWNEQAQAAQASETVMPKLVEAINTRQAAPVTEPPAVSVEPVAEIAVEEMTEVVIDGYAYIGFVGIPALDLELPVMSQWSYGKLQVAPCRFFGNINSDDLVILAHNYLKHFGNLKDLRIDDTVTFTDMDGKTTEYQVVALDILAPEAVEDMTSGDYDLTLFTCTYGGKSRVTVRCERTGD